MGKTLRWATVLLVLLFALSLIRTSHASTYTVSNTNDSGAGSLRQAIVDANNHAGPDTITFNISGCGGVCTISLGSALPALSAGQTTIDGYTQPGSAPATSSSPATLLIEIDGTAVQETLTASTSLLTAIPSRGWSSTGNDRGPLHHVTPAKAGATVLTGTAIGLGP